MSCTRKIAEELIASCHISDYPNAKVMREVASNELANAIAVEIEKVWKIHKDFLNGPYTELQKEVHQLRALSERAVVAGEKIVKERDRLRDALKMALGEIFKYAPSDEYPGILDEIQARAALMDANNG